MIKRSLQMFRSVALAMLVGLLTLVPATTSRAGDGQVLHVGETTTLMLDGKGWVLDTSRSRQAQLVSVKSAGATGATHKFSLRGLKPGQVTLVFRSGSKTFQANIDVLR